jgi:hypothetical protein
MSLRNLLVVDAVIGVAFGVAFVVATGPLLSVYGITLDKPGTLVAQLFGAVLIGFAVLNWLARNVTEPEMRQAVVIGNLVGYVIGFVLSLIGQLGGIANAVGWSTVAIYLLFTLAFAYVQFLGPRNA